MKSGDIFADEGSPALARAADPVTSHEAAPTVDTTKLEGEVLGVIRSYRDAGCIADQIVQQMNGEWRTITPRLAPLRRKGLIVVDGKRKGLSGRNQQIMFAKEFHNVEAA